MSAITLHPCAHYPRRRHPTYPHTNPVPHPKQGRQGGGELCTPAPVHLHPVCSTPPTPHSSQHRAALS
jgi:hypothetical protein